MISTSMGSPQATPYCWRVDFEDGTSHIGSDPFVTPVEARTPARRLRGRLTAPVTVWTSQHVAGPPAGITISSVLVADGTPPEVLGLVDPLSDFWDAVQETGRFVVHVLAAGQARLAEKFALRFPGDPFDGDEVAPTPWGPAFVGVATRAACTLVESADAGYARLVRAHVDEIVVDERPTRPLVYFRGSYLTLGPRRG